MGTYNFTEEAQKQRGAPEGGQVGFIAQEMETIVPEIVSEQDNIKAIAYSHTAPLVVSAIHEIYEELSTLKEQINQLKMENENLRRWHKERKEKRKKRREKKQKQKGKKMRRRNQL